MKKLILILMCSRIFTLPMTIMSWLVIFTYSFLNGGDVINGILALVGICLAHLGTNVFDDYIDYKTLIKQVEFDSEEYLKSSQKTKCRYIISGFMQEKDVLLLAFSYFLLAAIVGLALFIRAGIGVLYFGIIAAVLILLYPLLSRFKLSEILVGLEYGLVLYGGVYYVMTKTYSAESMLLSIATIFVTIILLYIHTVMDFEYDRNENKQTLANSFDSQLDSLIVLKVLLILTYVMPVFLCIFDLLDWQVFFVYLTLPLAIDLYKSMELFSTNPNHLPEHKWYHFPVENKDKLIERGEYSFMLRMYQSRNLMIYFSIIMVIAIFLAIN